jgi:hypothetical protein
MAKVVTSREIHMTETSNTPRKVNKVFPKPGERWINYRTRKVYFCVGYDSRGRTVMEHNGETRTYLTMWSESWGLFNSVATPEDASGGYPKYYIAAAKDDSTQQRWCVVRTGDTTSLHRKGPIFIEAVTWGALSDRMVSSRTWIECTEEESRLAIVSTVEESQANMQLGAKMAKLQLPYPPARTGLASIGADEPQEAVVKSAGTVIGAQCEPVIATMIQFVVPTRLVSEGGDYTVRCVRRGETVAHGTWLPVKQTPDGQLYVETPAPPEATT